MTNQMKAEWFKLIRNKTFWVLLVFITGLSALLHYLVIIEWWQLNNTPFDHAGLSELNALSIYHVLLFFNLIVSTLGGFYISNEFSQSSVIKNQIISGSKRSHIYLSKYFIFSFGSIVVTVIIPLIIAILLSIVLGHGDILSISNIFFLLRAFGLFSLQLLGYTAIITLLAIITEDSGRTIIISILFTLLMFAIEKLPKLPLISVMFENSIFYQFNEVFKFSMTNGEILQSILIAVISSIVITGIGLVVFNKKEIK